MAGRFDRNTRRTALGGVLAAGSLAVLWLACIAPTGSLGVTAVAGLFPMVAVVTSGRPAGFLCWAASAVLGLLLLPDKGVALLYFCFLGLYPVVKSHLEHLPGRVLEWVCKLAYFNLALTLIWFVFRALFLPMLPTWLEAQTWLIYVVGNVVFVAYDIGLSQFIGALTCRLYPGRR